MRVIIAARLSKLQKDGRPGIGLDTQDKQSRAWAEREGHEVITDPIADTKSGTVAPWDRENLAPWVTRPELMAQYDAIVAFKNDRLSRGVWADEARIRLWAEQHGKRLMIVDGPQWPPRHDGDKWAWESLADQARKEWEAGRERSMRAQAELKDRGMLVGRPPWGLASAGEKYNHYLVATPAGEQYAPEAFQRVADGGDDGKLPAVAAWLSKVTGKTWHPRMVAAMIRNPAYRGEYRERVYETFADSAGRERKRWTGEYGRVICKCPPLVRKELWRDANANLDGRPASRRGQRNDLATGAATLSGLALCGNPDCTAGEDSPMCKSGRYYRCTGRARGTGQRHGCGLMIPLTAADSLMDEIMGSLRNHVMQPIWHPATGHQVELDDVKHAIRELGTLDLKDDEYDARLAGLRAERDRLRGLPGKAGWTEFVPVLDEATGEPLTYGAKWLAADQAGRRAWLRDADFTLYLGRPGMLDGAGEDEADPYPFEALSRWDTWENDRAAIAFEWTGGDEDEGLARGLPIQDEDED
jgi:DNA invertase Pin-like site-specific DNA recombinase